MRKINSNLLSLFWVQFFGALNDNVFKNALMILITFHSISLFGLNSSMLVAFAGAVFIAPFFFLSATAGQLADAYDKIFIVKMVKKIEIIIMILAVIGIYFSNYLILFFVLFLLGIHSTFFGPLKYALIPHFSFKNDLVFSNALISGGTFVAILLGTVLGGVLKQNLLQIILLSFAIAGVFFSNRLPYSMQEQTKLEFVDWNFPRATGNILKLIFQDRNITCLTLGLSWFWFMGAGLLSLLPLLAKNILHGNEAIATILLFTFTLGMGIGPFVLELLTGGVIKKIIIPLSLLLMSVFIFDTALVIKSITNDHLWRLLIDLFLLSFFGGMYTVTQFAELQGISPANQISRIIAGNNVLNALFMVVVSLLLMTFFKFQIEIWKIFLILGFLNLTVSFILVFAYRKDIFNLSYS
jgi:MFS family permease